MKLFIDDERDPPESWWVARTSVGALEFLQDYSAGNLMGILEEVSFDHDLGGDDTSRVVVHWMAEHNVWPDRLVVHSGNKVGVEWLAGMADTYGPEHMTITIDGRPYWRTFGRRE